MYFDLACKLAVVCDESIPIVAYATSMCRPVENLLPVISSTILLSFFILKGNPLFSVDENEFAKGWMTDFPGTPDDVARAFFKRLDSSRFQTILLGEDISALDIADYFYYIDFNRKFVLIFPKDN